MSICSEFLGTADNRQASRTQKVTSENSSRNTYRLLQTNTPLGQNRHCLEYRLCIEDVETSELVLCTYLAATGIRTWKIYPMEDITGLQGRSMNQLE